jgi:hypothetical protein
VNSSTADDRSRTDLRMWAYGAMLMMGVFTIDEALALPPSSDAGVSMQLTAVNPQIESIRLAIQERIAPRGRTGGLALGPGYRGMAAGSDSSSQVWLGGSYGDSDLKDISVETDIKVTSLSAGYDLLFNKSLTAGVSLSGESSRLRYLFSLPGARGDGRMLTLAPYIGWSPSPGLTLDLILGMARGETDQNMTPGFTGTQSITRNYVAASVNQQWTRGGFDLSVRGGFTGTRQRNKAYDLGPTAVDASDSDTNRLQAGLHATYLNTALMPFAGVTYSYDLSRPEDSTLGRSGTLVSVGALWLPNRAGDITLGVTYQQEFGRSASRSSVFLLNLMARF